MATVEYIGARYVPVFFTNPTTGTTEWVNTVTFEPLTIVTYNGYSYTSKRFVPVGIDITNNQYWALTGNYNGQVAVYVERVNELAEQVAEISGDMVTADEVAQQITAALTGYATQQYVDNAIAAIDVPGLPSDSKYLPGLQGRYVVAIGDSLIRGDALPYSAAWPARITAAYGGSDANTLVSNKGYNGMSLAVRAGDSNDFFDRYLSIFADIDSTLSSRGESIPFAIVVQGGANDFNGDIPIGSRAHTNTNTSTFWGAMNQIRALIRNRYPKCRLMFMTTPIRKTGRNAAGLLEMDYGRAMLDFCRYFNIPCFDSQTMLGIDILNPDNTFAWALESADLPEQSTGATHYSAAAYEYMAPIIANWIITGASSTESANYIDTIVNLTAPSGSGFSITNYREIRYPGGYKNITFRVESLGVNPVNQSGGMYISDQIEIPFPDGCVIGSVPNMQITATGYNENFENMAIMQAIPSAGASSFKVKIMSPQSGNRSVQLYVSIVCNTTT